MEDRSVTHHTFAIERSYAATPERVFAAFSEPARKRRWMAEGEHHEVEKFEVDFRVDGRERFELRFGPNTPFPGILLSRDAWYQDIVPSRRIVIAATMAIGGKRISASMETFELLPTATGTDLIFTHQAAFFEGADGAKMREDGWGKLLGKLAAEV